MIPQGGKEPTIPWSYRRYYSQRKALQPSSLDCRNTSSCWRQDDAGIKSRRQHWLFATGPTRGSLALRTTAESSYRTNCLAAIASRWALATTFEFGDDYTRRTFHTFFFRERRSSTGGGRASPHNSRTTPAVPRIPSAPPHLDAKDCSSLNNIRAFRPGVRELFGLDQFSRITRQL